MRFATRALLATAVLGLGVGGALGFGRNKIVYRNFEWHVYTSPHFEVHYYPEEEEFLQQVVSDAESAYVRLSKFLASQFNGLGKGAASRLSMTLKKPRVSKIAQYDRIGFV